mgnify:CR=1 FL=1
MTIKTGLLGVSGYTGQVLLNLLLDHPVFDIKRIFSTSFEGPIEKLHSNMFDTRCPDVQTFDITICEELDLIFLAVPHTKAMPIVRDLNRRFPLLKIVDLSADFRHDDVSVFKQYYADEHHSEDLMSRFIYGIPEINRSELKSAQYCANPGCYAIASILGVLPFADQLKENQLLVIDAKSGVSGAGKVLKENTLFCEVNDAMSAYATGSHRHVPEIQSSLGHQNLVFSPHLIPQSRGELCSIYIANDQNVTQEELLKLYNAYYQDHPFVRIAGPDETSNTKTVVGSNCCVIKPLISKDSNTICVFSCIDNLLKGASGQAIQNFNLMFGLDEVSGLTTVARYL